MISRKRLSCTRDGCDYNRYRDKLCAGHWLEGNPSPLRQRPARKARPVRQRIPRKVPGHPVKGVTPETKAVVLARCGGRCEACGRPLNGRADFHHRQRRREGRHGPSNVVALHPSCHTVAVEAVHQRPTWAKERGLIVSSWADPAYEVLVLPDGRRVRLDDELASYQPPPDGVPYAA